MKKQLSKLFSKWNAMNSSNQLRIAEESLTRFEDIQGGNPNVFSHSSRILDVAEDEEDLVQELGAVFNIEKDRWVVPAGLPMEQFREFWPKIPQDLRAPNRRQLLTKNGKAREAYVLPDDEVRGGDSLAMPWMYAALVMLSIVTFGAIQVLGIFGAVLALPIFLLTTPYVISIAQSEGVKESAKVFFILYLLPLILSLGTGADSLKKLVPTSVSGITAGMGSIGTDLGMYLTIFIVYLMMAGFHCAVLTTEREENQKYGGTMGTKFDQFRALFKFGALFLVLMIVTNTIPNLFQALNTPVLKYLVYFKPLGFYTLACLYPLFYVSKEIQMRAQTLKMQENEFRGAKLGGLATVGDKSRNTQYEEALKDDTPLITLGKAMGVTEEKLYSYSYGIGGTIVMSIKDLSQHKMVLGATGAGKTESTILPELLQIKCIRIIYK
ncbi:hypothetical protein B9Y60_10610 [Stenotrophomonas maltophilia]|uniref:hypothetical protein n=1 Tax=Stenotrophomonas maltophilia TaxID=40324 RepID=UPI000C259D64|nr:hypothetical protein [Stenotrophomonas maltophilia]PJL52206.1 hypothetical protein B9Y73_10610 [Stenotrophomonas maltophilia]PJL55127.1 hypothetical protein B9Y60_10610 [Stenotrophomonas maltophilia]